MDRLSPFVLLGIIVLFLFLYVYTDDAHHFEFKFSNIDSKNPQRVFAIALKVSTGKIVSGT